MASMGGKMGVCRPIRGVPGSVKKLVAETAIEAEAQIQETNVITQQNDQPKRKNKAQASTK